MVGSNDNALEIVRTVAALREYTTAWRRGGESVGVVPTMGSLHDGHLALVAASIHECDHTIATLFVNPKQFDRADDLDSYPRDEARDQNLLREARCEILFAPDVGEMYPDGFATTVSVDELTNCMEGRHRPNHFDGVSTVVSKLLLQSQADTAYFGEKDYQQYLVVERMARDLNIPTRIRAVETVRDADGLALASRNVQLSEAERAIAPMLGSVLFDLAAALSDGETEATVTLTEASAALIEAGFTSVDYLELRRTTDLAELTRAEPPSRLFAAAWLGRTRLIDNVAVL